MKHKQKSNFWSLIIIGTLLFGASAIGLLKHAARSPTRAAEADSLSYPANPSTQPDLSSLPDRGVAAATQAETDKQMAISTAEALLRNEKITRSAEVGRAAQESALAAESYTPRDVVLEADGSQHVRMDRRLRGLPVVGGGIVVHSREGRLLSLTKTLDLQVPDAAAMARSPQPTLSQDQAVLAAKKYFQPELLQEPTTKTVYFAQNNHPVLAYEVEFLGNDEDRIPVNDLIYVDAGTAAYLGQDSKIYTAAARGTAYTLFRGKVEITTNKVTAQKSPERQPGYVLTDPSRGNGKTLNGENIGANYALIIEAETKYEKSGIVTKVEDDELGEPFFDEDNVWGTNQVDLSQRIGAEVHYGVATTWDYFKQRHDRNGIANDGKGVRALANRASLGQQFTNAAWLRGLNSMIYLNGSAEEGTNPVIELDVAGHEMSHGVNEATAKLMYERDSGGVNEASSDIFGTMVEFFDNQPKDPPNYLIGENIHLNGKPLRYMFKPSLDASKGSDGRQSASYDCYPKDGFTKENPHLTSGVANHFFYLLSEGAIVPKSQRTTLIKADLVCNGNTALRGITNKVAVQIWYRALTLYMTEQTTYPQAREATQRAAADLQERGLLSAKQVDAVACAWEAVEVPLPKGSKSSGCLRL